MADAKITDLTAKTRSQVTDATTYVVVVDTSNTTMDASGSNFKMLAAEFLAAGQHGIIGRQVAIQARTYL